MSNIGPAPAAGSAPLRSTVAAKSTSGQAELSETGFQGSISDAVAKLQGQSFESGAHLAALLQPHTGGWQVAGLASHPYEIAPNALELIAQGRDPRIFPDHDPLGLVHLEKMLISHAESGILTGLTVSQQERYPDAAAVAEAASYVRVANGDLVRPSEFYARRHPEVAAAIGYTGPVYETPSPALGRIPEGGHGRLVSQGQPTEQSTQASAVPGSAESGSQQPPTTVTEQTSSADTEAVLTDLLRAMLLGDSSSINGSAPTPAQELAQQLLDTLQQVDL